MVQLADCTHTRSLYTFFINSNYYALLYPRGSIAIPKIMNTYYDWFKASHLRSITVKVAIKSGIKRATTLSSY